MEGGMEGRREREERGFEMGEVRERKATATTRHLSLNCALIDPKRAFKEP